MLHDKTKVRNVGTLVESKVGQSVGLKYDSSPTSFLTTKCSHKANQDSVVDYDCLLKAV